MLNKPIMILLGVLIGISLSSCHIEQKDVETIARTTNSLRIYQPNDFIEYNVTAISGVPITTSQGMLQVTWEQLSIPLTDPITPGITYPLDSTVQMLKETTTLTYDNSSGGGSIEPDQTIIRYISQDSNGTVTLYAIDDGTGFYWLYDPTTTGNLSSNIILPVVFNSPMVFGPLPTVNFSVMEGCGNVPGQCGGELYKYTYNIDVVGDTTAISTNIGKFSDPFEIRFTGETIPQSGTTISIWAGIHNACGNSDQRIIHSGTMFILPEIGMIRMTNFLCQNIDAGTSVNYIFTINNTNFY